MRNIESGRYREVLAGNLRSDLMNQFESISDKTDNKDISSLQDILIRTYILQNISDCSNMSLKDFIRDFEKRLINYALLVSNHNQKKASALLGVKPTALCEKIKRYDIKLVETSALSHDIASEFDEIMTLYLQLDS